MSDGRIGTKKSRRRLNKEIVFATTVNESTETAVSNFRITSNSNIGINIENNGSTKTGRPSSIAGNLTIKYQNLSRSVLFYGKICSRQNL